MLVSNFYPLPNNKNNCQAKHIKKYIKILEPINPIFETHLG